MGKREKWCGALISLWLCLAFAPRAGHAASRSAKLPLVILTEHGRKDAEDLAFFASLRVHAAELGMLVSTHEVPEFSSVRETLLADARQGSKPFLVAWILREKGVRKLHFFDPWNNQLQVRSVEVGDSATANAESLALILRAELVAYLNEPPPPLPPPPLPPPPPPPPVVPPPAPRWGAAASLTLGTFLRDRAPWTGLHLQAWHAWKRIRLGVGIFAQTGHEIEVDGTKMVLHRYPAELFAGYASGERYRVRLVVTAGLSGELVTRNTSFATAPLSALPASYRFLAASILRGGTEIRLSPHLAAHLALGAEVPLNPHDFQITRGGSTETVARLSPIRATLDVGLTLTEF